MIDRPVVDIKALWIADADRIAARRHWGLALMAIGCTHLVFFLGLQIFLWRTGGSPKWPYPVTWMVELAGLLGLMRLICGRGWLHDGGIAGVVMRVWGTFFILSFNLASSNQLTGWELDWFKTAWCTLATFGFATMAWLFSLKFLIPAVAFYFLGLLSIRFPEQFFLIHGLAWWTTLMILGGWLELRRRGKPASAADVVAEVRSRVRVLRSARGNG